MVTACSADATKARPRNEASMSMLLEQIIFIKDPFRCVFRSSGARRVRFRKTSAGKSVFGDGAGIRRKELRTGLHFQNKAGLQFNQIDYFYVAHETQYCQIFPAFQS